MRAVDVTVVAGMSTAAVSFVLNSRDAGSISTTTRARIFKAVGELGYRPNHITRNLRQRSISSIGLVTDAVASSPFGGRLLTTTTGTAEASNQVLLMMDIGHRTGRVDEAIAALKRHQIDAIIYATMEFAELTEAPESRTPLVLADCVAPAPGLSFVSPDDAESATAALEHPADLDHRHVVILGDHYDPGNLNSGNVFGPVHWDMSRRTAERRSVEARHIGTDQQIDDGHTAALTTFDAPPGKRPTTLFTTCDRIATEALLAAAKLDPDVPGDVSAVGFNDQEVLAGRTVPALTAVALPRTAMGGAAVRMALDAVSGGSETPEHLVSPCPLVVRGSTIPPPIGAGQARHGTLGITSRASTVPSLVTTRLHGSS